MAYATLMTPTDVTLSNGCVVNIKDVEGNSVAPIWSFRFQGDHLSWGQQEYYDVDTDELVAYAYFPADGVWRGNERYNGDIVRIKDIVMQENGVSGRNYKWLLRQYQNDLDTGLPMCNIRFGSGIIQALPSGDTGTTITIDNGITKLRLPYYFTPAGAEEPLLIGCAYIEVGHERRMITDYNINTGVITIESGFSSGVVTVGALYRLYTNYIESGYYDFKIRDIPKINQSVSLNSDASLHMQGTYSHPNHVNMESYKFRLYVADAEENYVNGNLSDTFGDNVDNAHLPVGSGLSTSIIGKRIIIATNLPDITHEDHFPITGGYSGTIKAYDTNTGIATLVQDIAGSIEPGLAYSIYMAESVLIDESDTIYNYYLDYTSYAYFWDKKVTIELETVTKEKQVTRKSIQTTFATSGTAAPIECNIEQLDSLQALSLDINYPFPYINIYRKGTDDTIWQHIGQLYQTDKSFIDWTAANNTDYIYRFHFIGQPPVDTDTYRASFDGWSITSLIPTDPVYQKNKKAYKVGETWHFEAGNQPSDITQNLGIVQHTGTSQFPTTSRANTKYESGSFTTQLLTVECPSQKITDDIERVERWKKFINGDNPFLLKSDKGDVWVINIVNNPTRQYDESVRDIWTSVSYEWVQVEDTKRIYILP